MMVHIHHAPSLLFAFPFISPSSLSIYYLEHISLLFCHCNIYHKIEYRFEKIYLGAQRIMFGAPQNVAKSVSETDAKQIFHLPLLFHLNLSCVKYIRKSSLPFWCFFPFFLSVIH